MLTPGEGVRRRRARRGRVVPRAAADARPVPDETAAAVRPGQRGRRASCAAPRRARPCKPGDRVAAFCALGGFAETAVAPGVLHLPALAGARLRAGRGADPQLPHRLLLRCVLRGRLQAGEIGARARRRGRRRHGLAAGRQGARRAHDRGRLQRGEEATSPRQAGADEVVLLGEGWKDEVLERSGGGVDVVLDPVGGDRFTDSLRSLREDGRLLVVGFTGGVDPRGAGEPAAAEEHLGRGRRLGRLRDGQARPQPRDRRGASARWSTTGFVRPIVGAALPLRAAPPRRCKRSTSAARPARSCSTSGPSSRSRPGSPGRGGPLAPALPAGASPPGPRSGARASRRRRSRPAGSSR